MSGDALTIRPASPADLPRLGQLGAQLVHLHHGFDRARFMAPGESLEEGYAAFLSSQMSRREAVVLVAALEGHVVGYVYAAVEPLSWEELRDETGYIHDIIVDDSARGRGVARQLVDAAAAWCRERGLPRIVLWTAERNDAAQRLFAKLGFRRTMIEMTREID